MRVLLAGIFGGILMFVRTSIAHMALPLGEAGIDILRAASSHSANRSPLNSALNFWKRFWRFGCWRRRELTRLPAGVGFVFVTGTLAAIATNVSYWNWYGFPAVYTASYILIEIPGFFS